MSLSVVEAFWLGGNEGSVSNCSIDVDDQPKDLPWQLDPARRAHRDRGVSVALNAQAPVVIVGRVEEVVGQQPVEVQAAALHVLVERVGGKVVLRPVGAAARIYDASGGYLGSNNFDKNQFKMLK